MKKKKLRVLGTANLHKPIQGSGKTGSRRDKKKLEELWKDILDIAGLERKC